MRKYLRLEQFRTVEIDNTADALALAVTVDVVVTGIVVPGPFVDVNVRPLLRSVPWLQPNAVGAVTRPVANDGMSARTAACSQGDQEEQNRRRG
jgi:hypothetical protein